MGVAVSVSSGGCGSKWVCQVVGVAVSGCVKWKLWQLVGVSSGRCGSEWVCQVVGVAVSGCVKWRVLQ